MVRTGLMSGGEGGDGDGDEQQEQQPADAYADFMTALLYL